MREWRRPTHASVFAPQPRKPSRCASNRRLGASAKFHFEIVHKWIGITWLMRITALILLNSRFKRGALLRPFDLVKKPTWLSVTLKNLAPSCAISRARRRNSTRKAETPSYVDVLRALPGVRQLRLPLPLEGRVGRHQGD